MKNKCKYNLNTCDIFDNPDDCWYENYMDCRQAQHNRLIKKI